jgi:PKD repeat protein
MQASGVTRTAAVAFFMVISIVLIACAQSVTSPSTKLESPTAQPAQPDQVKLPSPSLLPRSASAAPWRVRPGGWFKQLPPYTFNLVTALSGRAQFQPEYDRDAVPPLLDFAYCMFEYNLAGIEAQPAEVRHGWQIPPTTWGNLWWGLANWDKDRWDWFQATGASPQALSAPAFSDYIAADGRVVLVALLLGTQEAQLNWVAVGGNLPPDASYEVDPTTPAAGEQVTFSATSSMDYDGTIAKFEFDFGEGAGLEDFGATDTTLHTYNTAGQYTSRVRVTDDGGLTDTESFVIDVGAAPHGVIASLTADPPGGSPIVTIEFDASASLPSTGAAITRYDFDFDGDGAVDQSGAEPVGYHAFNWGGDCIASVTVFDDALQSGSASLPVTLMDERNWQVAFQASCGETFALVDAGGCPALAFNTSDFAQILFVRANDALGAAWPTPVLIDALGPFKGRMDAEVIDGKPSLAYTRLLTEQDLYVRYLHSLDETGMLDGNWSAIDAAPMGYITANTSTVDLIPVGAGAGIAYHIRTPASVQFIRSEDADGTTWDSPVKIDDIELTGINFVSACIQSGKPVVAYTKKINQLTYSVFYKQAVDTLGSTFGPAVTVIDEAAKAYGQESLCINEQNGAFAVLTDYTNSGESRFLYPDPENPGGFISINPCPWGFYPNEQAMWTIVAGNPALVGHDFRNNALYFARASNPAGTSWPSTDPQEIIAGDPEGTEIGLYPKLLTINGTPIVAYYDAGTQKVFVAVLK